MSKATLRTVGLLLAMAAFTHVAGLLFTSHQSPATGHELLLAQGTQGTLVGIPFGTTLPIACNPAFASQQNPLFYLTQTQGANRVGMNWCIALNQFASPVVTIASGTAVLGTSLISAGTCATTVTSSAAGVTSADNVAADFSADPTSTTGYAPGGSGILTIIKFPAAGAVKFDVCNNTSGNITPGAVTLNWRVQR